MLLRSACHSKGEAHMKELDEAQSQIDREQDIARKGTMSTWCTCISAQMMLTCEMANLGDTRE